MYTYLALGDSYTIGEQVPLEDNFPYQTVRMLRERNIEVADPVIIARTGWTTDELTKAVLEEGVKEQFSFVTLLIGVNNQYRGRDIMNYRTELLALIQQALHFANGKPDHVFVLSIPDWGVTPFASDRDRNQVAKEIDAFNKAKKEIAEEHGVVFIDITESTRANGTKTEYLTEDALHPSSKEYTIWAERLVPYVAHALKG